MVRERVAIIAALQSTVQTFARSVQLERTLLLLRCGAARNDFNALAQVAHLIETLDVLIAQFAQFQFGTGDAETPRGGLRARGSVARRSRLAIL